MKQINTYINEKLKISKEKGLIHKYFPKNRKELQDLIYERIEKEGPECDLNDIDTSKITDMTSIFANDPDSNMKIDIRLFNGDISLWDVSNVKDMSYMFFRCKKFNCDLSRWDVSNVQLMSNMFNGCESFNQPLNNWDVRKVTRMRSMFSGCKSFNQPLDKWDISNVYDTGYMFYDCKNLDQDFSKWDVSKVGSMDYMFFNCEKFYCDLESWSSHIRQVANMNSMFNNTKLEKNPPEWYLSRIKD